MIEDRLRGLKLRVPVKGVRAKLAPSEDELDQCRDLGRTLALHLTGRNESKIIDMAALA
jgi:flavorubredoxin